MRKYLTPALLLTAAMVLILDSRCAAGSVREALELCTKSLIPGLFPLFVVSAMAVPHLRSLRFPALARLLKLPPGNEGLYLLGTAGGFPVGAVCIAQSVRAGSLSKTSAQRMLGLCSNCGPAFLFGVLAAAASPKTAVLIFLFQLISSLTVGSLWPGDPDSLHPSEFPSVPLTDAVKRAIGSMATVCGWVILAAVVTGFLRRWLFPLLPDPMQTLLTGLLELTGGIMALPTLPEELQLLLGSGMVSFGGVSVLLQIRAVAAEAGLRMGPCIAQKTAQALAAVALACGYLRFGWAAMLLPLSAKIAVEISGGLVYNTRRKEGI